MRPTLFILACTCVAGPIAFVVMALAALRAAH